MGRWYCNGTCVDRSVYWSLMSRDGCKTYRRGRLATRRNGSVTSMALRDERVDEPVATLPAQAWRRRSCGDGAHGQGRYAWARVAIRP